MNAGKRSRPRRVARDPFADVSELIDELVESGDISRSDQSQIETAPDTTPQAPHSDAEATQGVSIACPYLAQETESPSSENVCDPRRRCFAGGKALPILPAHQTLYCLQPEHESCARFLEYRQYESEDPPREYLGFLKRLLRRT